MKHLPTLLALAISSMILSASAAVGQQMRHSPPKDAAEVRALAKALREAGSDGKRAVFDALTNVSTDAVHLGTAFGELLDDKDETVQMAGIRAVGRLKIKAKAPKVRDLLSRRSKHKISDERDLTKASASELNYIQEAVGTLVELDDVESIDAITARDEFMCCMAGVKLARLGAKALPRVLAKAKKGWAQKQGAGSMIQFMRDEAAVPKLVELLNGPDRDFSARAAQTLSAIVHFSQSDSIKKTIVTQFEAGMGNENPRVRAEMYGGLLAADAALYGPSILKKLEREDEMTRRRVLYAISGHRVKAAESFLEQFIRDDERRNPNPDPYSLRAEAARILFALTGKKVPYKGLEEQMKRYKDPYQPHAHE